MRLLEGYTRGYFRTLEDGRTLFLPKGEDGPAYLVPHDATRERLERQLKFSGLLMALLAVGVSKLLYVRGTFHWPALLGIPVILFVRWRIAARAAEELQELHDPRLFESEPDRAPEYDNLSQSWARLATAVMATVAGLLMLFAHPQRWVQWAGFFIAVVFAWSAQLVLQEIRRSRQSGQSTSDGLIFGRTHVWSGNRRSRRFS